MDKGITIDDKFVAKLKKGDEESFHRLYNHIAPGMKLVCRRYVKNVEDAEDVFHEGFLKVYSNVRKLKDAGAFGGWIKRIFVNSALDYHRKSKKKSAEYIDEINESHLSGYDVDETDGYDMGYDASISDDDCAIIRKVDFSQDEMLGALNLIPDHYRIIFQLFVIDEYKHQEISEMLSINENTSKTRLLRGRGLLKKELCKLAIQKLSNGQN